MIDFINMYFALCIIAWAIDIIAVVAIVAIKPLRKWCWKKYLELTREFCLIYQKVFEDLDE